MDTLATILSSCCWSPQRTASRKASSYPHREPRGAFFE